MAISKLAFIQSTADNNINIVYDWLISKREGNDFLTKCTIEKDTTNNKIIISTGDDKFIFSPTSLRSSCGGFQLTNGNLSAYMGSTSTSNWRYAYIRSLMLCNNGLVISPALHWLNSWSDNGYEQYASICLTLDNNDKLVGLLLQGSYSSSTITPDANASFVCHSAGNITKPVLGFNTSSVKTVLTPIYPYTMGMDESVPNLFVTTFNEMSSVPTTCVEAELNGERYMVSGKYAIKD